MGMSKQSFLSLKRALKQRNPALTDNLNLCPPDAWIDRDQPTALGATWPAPQSTPFASAVADLGIFRGCGRLPCNQTFFLSAQYAKPLIPRHRWPLSTCHRPEDGRQPVGVTATAILIPDGACRKWQRLTFDAFDRLTIGAIGSFFAPPQVLLGTFSGGLLPAPQLWDRRLARAPIESSETHWQSFLTGLPAGS